MELYLKKQSYFQTWISRLKLLTSLPVCVGIILLAITFFSCGQDEDDTVIDPTRIIAHCGYWTTGGSCRNSLSSLINAQGLNIYGSEFDVRVTSDGIPVIYHDKSIDGKIIDLTTYASIKNYKLGNGELLPTLEEYLKVGAKDKNTQLILEIKASSINDVKIIIGMVDKYDMAKNVEYISFHLGTCLEVHRLSPSSKISYLNGDLAPSKVKELGLTGIDYDYNILQKNIHWIREAKELGLTTNVWVVNQKKLIKYFINEGVDFITTDYPASY